MGLHQPADKRFPPLKTGRLPRRCRPSVPRSPGLSAKTGAAAPLSRSVRHRPGFSAARQSGQSPGPPAQKRGPAAGSPPPGSAGGNASRKTPPGVCRPARPAGTGLCCGSGRPTARPPPPPRIGSIRTPPGSSSSPLPADGKPANAGKGVGHRLLLQPQLLPVVDMPEGTAAALLIDGQPGLIRAGEGVRTWSMIPKP